MRKSQEIRTYEAVETSMSPFSSISLTYVVEFRQKMLGDFDSLAVGKQKQIESLFAQPRQCQKTFLNIAQGGYAAY